MAQTTDTAGNLGTGIRTETATMAEFCRAQFERANDLACASMDGAERLQQLTLQAMRTGMSQQFGLMQDLAVRSTQTLAESRFDLIRATVERLVEVQRDVARAVVDVQRRMFEAVSASAQGTGRILEQAGTSTRDAPQATSAEGGPADLMTQAIEQWRSYMGRMIDLAERQASSAGDSQRHVVVTLDETADRATGEAQEQIRRGTDEAAGRGNATGAGTPGSRQGETA